MTVSSLSAQAEAILDSAHEHLLSQGLGDFSLRNVAKALGTSHRMLIYHFGSKEEFLQALLRRIRQGQQEKWGFFHLAEQGPDTAQPLFEAWQQFAADRARPRVRLLFEVYGAAIREPDRYQEFLGEVVHSWLSPLEEWSQKLFPDEPAKARAYARLQVAVIRGLLLDLVTTGDYEATTEAMRFFTDTMEQVRREARAGKTAE